MSKVENEIEKAPGLEYIRNLFPPSTSSSPIAKVSMKLPAFWPDSAEVWFAQADAQFVIRIISVSKTKFYHPVLFSLRMWLFRYWFSSVLLLLEIIKRFSENC